MVVSNRGNGMGISRGREDPNTLVEAKRGAVVYCDLIGDYAEHSGIYVGDGKIVNLNRKGEIKKVTFKEFITFTLDIKFLPDMLKNSIKFTTGDVIYVSCKNGKSVGSDVVADRALSMVGKSRDYNMIMDNCHQFTAGCLTGDFKGAKNFLWMLKDEAYKAYGSNQWCICYKKKTGILDILASMSKPVKD